ncbi:hypothetical protein MACJ_002150 [Theileria orientalis]|uniref:Uncharacterized protein n=1 Tax=Theileria orientalis TaxID=68886 RepID=A0A976M5J5_THEOR|nr:hypothetical protein MACJ_002150 [Theileria orientalis]
MVHSQESFIIANFVSKLRTSSPLSCDCLPQEAEFCESEADVTLYERYIESGRCQKIIQCSLDALSVIREVSTGYADLHWNPGLKPGDIATFKIIYPVLRSSLDCLLNQISPGKSDTMLKLKESKENYSDSSTLTFEGLFLLIKTALEFIHPLAYSCDGVVLSQLISLLERTSYNVQLANANLSSLTVYLCRLYSFGYIIRVPENDDMILRQHSVLFYRVICVALSSSGRSLDPNALLFLKRVVGSVLFIINENVSDNSENINDKLVLFMSKFIDVWYASMVKMIVSIRTDTLPALLLRRTELISRKRETESSSESNGELEGEPAYERNERAQLFRINTQEKSKNVAPPEKVSENPSEKDPPKPSSDDFLKDEKVIMSDKDRMLMKLCKLTYETPKLPPSHRMRLITQIIFVLLESNSNELELEALNAILVLMDFTDETSSGILKSNLLPLLKVLTGILMSRVEASGIGLVSIVEECQIEKYVLLVYCLGQVLLNVVLFKYEHDEENVDTFLQEQVKLIDPSRRDNYESTYGAYIGDDNMDHDIDSYDNIDGRDYVDNSLENKGNIEMDEEIVVDLGIEGEYGMSSFTEIDGKKTKSPEVTRKRNGRHGIGHQGLNTYSRNKRNLDRNRTIDGSDEADSSVTLQSWDLELFEMTSNVMKIFNLLLSVNDDKVDEAVTHVICWMLTETNFEYTFKLAVPICCLMLRTKNSRMLDAIYGKSGTRVTTTQIAMSTSRRWLSGSKIFKTSLEYYLNTLANNESSDEIANMIEGDSEAMGISSSSIGNGDQILTSSDQLHGATNSDGINPQMSPGKRIRRLSPGRHKTNDEAEIGTNSSGAQLDMSADSSTNNDMGSGRAGEDEVDLYSETDTVIRSLFLSMFESYLEVMVETSGNVEEEIEDCLGLYFSCFGMEDYLKRMPLERLYKVPITNERYTLESYSFMLPVLKRQLKGLKMGLFAKHILPVLNSLDYFVNKTAQVKYKAGCMRDNTGDGEGSRRAPSEKWSRRLRYINKLESVHNDYEGVYNQLLQLCVPLSSDPDCIEVLVDDNYMVLKYIVTLLDKGTERFNTACKVIENFEGLNIVALELIGILVKKYINIEINMERSMDNGIMCENILAAIGNVSKYCESEVLSKNLQSFEKALNGRRNDALVRLSKSLFPYVSDDLKHNMYRNYLNQPRDKFVYVALRVALETVMEKLETNKGLLRAVNNVSLNPYKVDKQIGSEGNEGRLAIADSSDQSKDADMMSDALNAQGGSATGSAVPGVSGDMSFDSSLGGPNAPGVMEDPGCLSELGLTPGFGVPPIPVTLGVPVSLDVPTSADHQADLGSMDHVNIPTLMDVESTTTDLATSNDALMSGGNRSMLPETLNTGDGTTDSGKYGEDPDQNDKELGLRTRPNQSTSPTPIGIAAGCDTEDYNDEDDVPTMDLDDPNLSSQKQMRDTGTAKIESEDNKTRPGSSLSVDESGRRWSDREVADDGKERGDSDDGLSRQSSDEFEDSDEHQSDGLEVDKNWEEDDEYKFVKMVVKVNGMCELATYLEILSESVDTTKQRITCLVTYTKLLLYLKETLYNVDYDTLIALITKPLIFECVVNCCTNNKANRTNSFAIYHMLCRLNGNYHHVLKVTLSTLYYNHAINKEGENVNIGIMKLLCNIFGACYSEFDNIETLRLVVYLSGRLTQCSYRFYVQLLKFFRVVMVHMNNDHLIQAAQHMMKLFNNERYSNRAKTYVRRLVEKMLIRLKRDHIFSIFPKKHFPLLNNIITTRRRKFNKALDQSRGETLRRRRPRKDGEDDYEDEDDDDDFDDDFDDEFDFREFPYPFNGFEPISIVDESVPKNKQHLLVRRRAAAAHKLKKKAMEEKSYRYIKINRKGNRRETVKVLKSIIKNRHK